MSCDSMIRFGNQLQNVLVMDVKFWCNDIKPKPENVLSPNSYKFMRLSFKGYAT